MAEDWDNWVDTSKREDRIIISSRAVVMGTMRALVGLGVIMGTVAEEDGEAISMVIRMGLAYLVLSALTLWDWTLTFCFCENLIRHTFSSLSLCILYYYQETADGGLKRIWVVVR